MTTLKLSTISLPIFALMDYLFLGLLMAPFYSRELGSLARRAGESLAPDLPSAGLVYILMALSVAVFILPRFAGKEIGLHTFALGALLGLVIYGIYDLTNYSLLSGWSVKLAAVDVAWGCVIYGTNSVVTGLIGRALKLL